MKKSTLVQFIAVVFALAAAWVCYTLLLKHVTRGQGPAWFEWGCSETAEPGGANCAAVLASAWSYWPPKQPNEPPQTPHLPVAFLGLVYYSLLAVWFIVVGRPSAGRRWVHIVPVSLVALGLLLSALFTFIMFTRVSEWCPWCMLTHVLNVLIAVCVFLMWPPGAAAAERPKQGSTRPASVPAAPEHPSLRTGLCAALALVLVFYGNNQLLGRLNRQMEAATLQEGMGKCKAALDRLKDATFSPWQTAPKYEVTVRADDVNRTAAVKAEEALTVVVFSDFQCPKCAALAKFLDEKAQPLFDGNLRVVFKHYPLHSACNPQTVSRMHEYACSAARMAEAARLLGGGKAFWYVHDYLFENLERLRAGVLKVEEAVPPGVDPRAFAETVASDTVLQRIREDAELGKSCGVVGTPGVFVMGRRVDELAVLEPRFWNQLANVYWEQGRHMPRPTNTLLKSTDATPGSPDPSTAP
ncbi:MAG: thioredoxin domain-containing protein [Planctomycetes bacterium]|nr:thioredoxin domain-containing protein [Planctomycetota bacterium]